ncbi:response regulator transcription factor [Paenibacillus sp. GCM10023250]|uniref:response regulator transcription factor n=1 Tax=Paenibacillus sp. GCM10023250 TaxID=3252648 RepID=UPI00361DA09C
MLTVFLVEDEAIELNLMMNHIDWASMGIRVLGGARNGRKAWEQIQALRPDVVLTDVRMPFMDGLQLAALIQAHCEWTKVVFLSGHDEFAYVKSALESGAVGYLLKPIDRVELAAVMAKAKAEAEKAKLLRRSRDVLAESHMARLFADADEPAREHAWFELTALDPGFAERKFVTALISVDGYEALLAADPERAREVPRTGSLLRELLDARRPDGTALRLGGHEWLVALPAEDGADAEAGGFWAEAAEAVRAAFGWTATVGVSAGPASLREGGTLLAQARAAAEERFFDGPGRVTLFASLPARLELGRGDGGGDGDILPGKLDLADREAAAEAIGRFFDLMVRLRANKARVLAGAHALLGAIAADRAKYGGPVAAEAGEPDDWARSAERAETLAELRERLLALAAAIGEALAGRQPDRHLQLVQQVAGIIEEEFGASLTIDDLAGRVFLSPNYLRVLFKEKMGCTVHEYLTRVRLNQSLELLRDKSLKIHDVARRVGYDNTSYFCSFFYKTQGVTPNEYRKKFL